ncbi:MAG: CDP-alcohol phosphatidyltransferase family protein [Planctomycetes bacterium]|nr:CDP-alcohol phosphatidyltransferase family protein [Planctomycetota bacterium]
MLPSVVTLGALACGLGALVYCTEALRLGKDTLLTNAGWLLVLAMSLDAVDGKLARLTRSTSELGAQLDSLSDMVTFGVVPAVMLRTLVLLEGPELGIRMHPRLLVVAPIVYACCAALRLARFNVEHAREDPQRDHRNFVGLPSPAAAALPISLTLFYFGVPDVKFIEVSDRMIELVRSTTLHLAPFLLLCLGMLMVTRLPFPHFVAWATRVRNPFQRLAEMVIIFGLLLTEPELALVLLSVLFIAFPAVLAMVRLLRARLLRRRTAG